MTDTSITTISIKRLMFKETSERNSPSILKTDTASRIARSRHHSNLELLSWLT
jgi:hypothetical protein